MHVPFETETKMQDASALLLMDKSRGENQKGVSDISPTLQESQNKIFTSLIWLCILISIVYNKNVYTHGWQYFCQ